MGTYDKIKCKDIRCPDCGKSLKGIQTKGGPRLFRQLIPGSTWKLHEFKDNEYYNQSNIMTAYGECPKCRYMWDVFIPLIHVTGMAIISPNIDEYKYEKAKWAIKPR
jgi:hypothetical protein